MPSFDGLRKELYLYSGHRRAADVAAAVAGEGGACDNMQSIKVSKYQSITLEVHHYPQTTAGAHLVWANFLLLKHFCHRG